LSLSLQGHLVPGSRWLILNLHLHVEALPRAGGHGGEGQLLLLIPALFLDQDFVSLRLEIDMSTRRLAQGILGSLIEDERRGVGRVDPTGLLFAVPLRVHEEILALFGGRRRAVGLASVVLDLPHLTALDLNVFLSKVFYEVFDVQVLFGDLENVLPLLPTLDGLFTSRVTQLETLQDVSVGRVILLAGLSGEHAELVSLISI